MTNNDAVITARSPLLSAEQRLTKAAVYIMRAPQWVGYFGVLMVGKSEVVDDPITACTDGFNVKYGRAFVDSLTDKELRFVMLHETLHKMYRHLVVWQRLFRQDPVRANMACDHVVNLMISEVIDPGVLPPKNGEVLMDPQFKGLDVLQVFQRLPPSPPCPGCSGRAPGSVAGQPGISPCNHRQTLDEHEWDQAAAPNPQEQAARAAEVDSAIRQGAIMAGKVAGGQTRGFDELMAVPIDWKEVLRQFITTYCRGGNQPTYRRPNRRYLQYDMYMPSTISETLDTVLIGSDTSGSIQGAALTEFVSCAVGILEQVDPMRTDLLYWDHKVAGHEIYFQGEVGRMRSTTSPKGGGGTAPSCITKYLQEHNLKPTCAIILTDGHVGGDWGGQWPCPVLWVIKGNKHASPTTGAAVHF